MLSEYACSISRSPVVQTEWIRSYFPLSFEINWLRLTLPLRVFKNYRQADIKTALTYKP